MRGCGVTKKPKSDFLPNTRPDRRTDGQESLDSSERGVSSAPRSHGMPGCRECVLAMRCDCGFFSAAVRKKVAEHTQPSVYYR